MEYTNDKTLHRQRICMKCKSFVTHDKIDDHRVSCPLCGHQVKTPKSRVEFLGIKDAREILLRRFGKNQGSGEDAGEGSGSGSDES